MWGRSPTRLEFESLGSRHFGNGSFGGYWPAALRGQRAAVGEGYVKNSATFGETNVGNPEFVGELRHGLRPNELVKGLTGQGERGLEHVIPEKIGLSQVECQIWTIWSTPTEEFIMTVPHCQ
jgi:hypothetical protein